MLINSVLNSDSEQCTESKLSRVHQVHTLAQPARALLPGWPCRCRVMGLCPAISWLVAGRVVAVLQAWPRVPCHRAPACVVVRHFASLPTLYHGALLSCIVAQCRPIGTQSHPFSHDTNLCIAILLPTAGTARLVARAHGRIAGRLVVSWPSSGHIVAEQWLYCGLLRRVVARPCALPPSLACHNTVCCIVTQTKKKRRLGSSPFHVFLHFFFLIPAIGKTTKNKIK